MDKNESISISWNRIYLSCKNRCNEVNENWLAWVIFHGFILEKLFLGVKNSLVFRLTYLFYFILFFHLFILYVYLDSTSMPGFKDLKSSFNPNNPLR